MESKHAEIAFGIMEGGASNATALAGEALRMLIDLPVDTRGELNVTKSLFGILRDARAARDDVTAGRIAGLLVESANSEYTLAGLDYAPVYIVLDQIRNILGLTCYRVEYYARWARMWEEVKRAAEEEE